MKKPFHILLVLLSLFIGIHTVVSCSSVDFDKFDLSVNSSGDGDLIGSISSSSVAQSNSASSSSIGSSSSAPPPEPPVEIDIPPSGHYATGLTITVPVETEQGVVHCDTSGAAPNESSPIQSGSELELIKTTILQCAYFKNGKPPSRTVLRTYIVGRLPDLPIVSIAVNQYDMFDAPEALYKSSFKVGADCGGGYSSFYTEEEIPIHVDFFEKGAEFAWSYPAGIHIHGGCSRMHPKKSVIVSFRESYGQKNLRYSLFPEHPHLTKFKHFMLRNNGNNYDYDYIRDMLMESLTEGLDIDYQKGRAVVVYYNGRYYGIHNLRERTNSDYFETNYNMNEDNIDLVSVENEGIVKRGSDEDYQRIVSWLEVNSLASSDNNNLRQLEQWIDVDNFTNHFQSRIFYKDCDWPGKNMKRWRNNLMRTKWRWLLYDTDHGFGSWGTSHLAGRSMMQFITSTNGPSWPNPPHSTFLLRKLLENQSYKNAFINRFSVLIATYFTTERINARKSKLEAAISSEVMYDQQRWSTKSEMNLPQTMASFISSRPSSMQSELGTFFSIGTPVNLTLSVSGGGKILVHNLPLPEASVTFKAYPTIPITIKAEGVGFKNWSGGGINTTEREITVTIATATTLTANF